MGRTVIIIGAGLAGMTAACAAQKEGGEVILIDRGSVGLGTNTALAGGVFSGPTASYATEQYIQDTLQIGKMINHRPRVELVAREAVGAIEFLRSLGLNLTEFSNHYASRPRNLREIPGVVLVKEFSRAISNLPGISVRTGLYVTEIRKKGDRVRGIRGIDKSGEETDIDASTVVLAAGGAGAIYLNNDNQKNMMGQGYYLAAMAGLDLWDMEFVQFYPVVLAEPRLPSMLVYPPYAKEIKLINSQGENVLAKYDVGDINEAILKKRDQFSEILFREIALNPVFMDCRDVPASSWDLFPLNLLARLKFDFRTKPVRISSATHFFMGGVRVDETGQTSLPGLFACGEVVWGLHGANRRGGNALTECAVTGKIAGSNAARYASTGETPACKRNDSEKESATDIKQSDTGMRLRKLRLDLRKIAWNRAGIFRTDQGLQEGLAQIGDTSRKVNDILPQTVNERKLKEDLLAASFVLKAILTASIGRKESRGSFNREDFPEEDNVNRLKNSCLAYDRNKDAFALSYHDVM